jgi:membrane protease YdiL (CAAX protease family)
MSAGAPNDPNANEPPLVTRAEQPPAPAPHRPRPGFWEACAWCAVFILAQMFGALVAVVIAFGAHTLASPNPKQFADEQLEGFSKALDPKAQGERPPIPRQFAEALAYGMLAAQFVSLGLILIVLPRRIGPDWKREIGVRRPQALHFALVILIVPGFMILAGVIQELYQWATGLRPMALESIRGVFVPFPWPLTVLAVAIGPGIVEELWCRGFVGRGLSARYGIVTSVFVTSLLFAAMHIDPSQFLGIAIMGAYLHFVYLTTRSIWAPILLHALNNGVAIALALTMRAKQLEQAKDVPLIVSLVALSLMIFGSVALWTSRATLEPVTARDEAWWESDGWKPESPGVSAPPPGANVRLAHEVVSPAALLFTIVSFGVLIYLGYRFLV